MLTQSQKKDKKLLIEWNDYQPPITDNTTDIVRLVPKLLASGCVTVNSSCGSAAVWFNECRTVNIIEHFTTLIVPQFHCTILYKKSFKTQTSEVQL